MIQTDKDSVEKNIILATSIPEERDKLIDILRKKDASLRVHCPDSLVELDKICTESEIKLIITDLDFQNGSLADWLVLWPYPFILLVKEDEEEKLANLLSDESSSFLLRRNDLTHLNYLTMMCKKVLNIRESLERQNNFLKLSEKQYMNLVQALPDIIYVLDSEGRFTFINNAVRILGWEPVELIGRHFSELLFNDDLLKVSREKVLPPLRGKVTGEDRAPKLFDERRSGSRMTRGLKLKLRRNSSVGGSVNVLLTSYGEISSIGYDGFQKIKGGIGTAGIIRERKNTGTQEDDDSNERVLDTKGALSHDQVMHLINNKLQVLSSLVSLKQSFCEDTLASSSLNEIQNQIYTLSLVYQNMVTIDGKVRIRMRSYIEDIIKHLVSSYAGNPWLQKMEIISESITLEEDKAITISLLLNEIIATILKIQTSQNTAIPPSSITLLQNDGMIQLKIRTTEKINNIYTEKLQEGGAEIIISALADILDGELFTDKDSITIFFNAE